MKRVVLVVFNFVLISWFIHQHVFAASGIIAGTGQSVAASTDVNQATMTTAAAHQAKIAYQAQGGLSPKVIIVIENITEKNSAIKNAIQSEFGSGVPIMGVETSWPDYTPFTIANIPTDNTQSSIAILALGGDDISIQAAKAYDATDIGNTAQTIAAGSTIAQSLTIDPTKHNLLFLLGSMHVGNNNLVIQGMQNVWGKPLPSYIRIIGGGSPDWGGPVFYNGQLSVAGTAIGILITGDYDWAFRGIDHGELGWGTSNNAVTEIGHQTDLIIQELHGVPDVTFLIPGHPDRSLFPAIRDVLASKLGAGANLIGQHAGSETGHDSTATDVIPDASHFFIAGIKSKSTNTCYGDINKDTQVDGTDYSLLRENLLNLHPTPAGADINGDGITDIGDYTILAGNFLKSCN